MISNNDMDNFDNEAGNLDDDLIMDDLEQKNTLGDLWQSNPMIKIVAVLVVIATFIGAMILFGGGGEQGPQSVVSRPQDVSEAPGASTLSPAISEALQQNNADIYDTALQTGGSAIPTPINPLQNILPAPDMNGQQPDPLQDWREAETPQNTFQPVMEQQVDPNAEAARQAALGNLANAMTSQMQKILESRRPGRLQQMGITTGEALNGFGGQPQQPAPTMVNEGGAAYTGTGGPVTIKVLLPAGTIEYGQMLLESNSDAPGPVLAQVVSGPFSGGRILGTFQTTERYLVLNFHTLVKQGVSYPVNAIAIDPTNTLPALRTEIDHRYFERIVLPAAARFVEGMGRAVSRSGRTSVTVSGDTVIQDDREIDTRQELYSGVEEAGRQVADVLEEEGNRTRPMIRVKAGEPVGILFTQNVTEMIGQDGKRLENQQMYQQAGQPTFGAQQGMGGMGTGFGMPSAVPGMQPTGQMNYFGSSAGQMVTPYGATAPTYPTSTGYPGQSYFNQLQSGTTASP